MEQTVTRLRFRLAGRGTTAETEGRILENPDGTRILQVGCSTPEHPHILLEVGPVETEAALWPLFQRLCEYRNFQPLEYRRVGARGPGDWEPLPTAPEAKAGPADGKAGPGPKKKK